MAQDKIEFLSFSWNCWEVSGLETAEYVFHPQSWPFVFVLVSQNKKGVVEEK